MSPPRAATKDVIESYRSGTGPPPAGLARVLLALRAAGTDLSSVVAALEPFPGLAERIVRFAGFLRPNGQASPGRLDDAIATLGTNLVELACAVFSIEPWVRRLREGGVPAPKCEVPLQAVSSALAVRGLARKLVPELSEEAFLCGLLLAACGECAGESTAVPPGAGQGSERPAAAMRPAAMFRNASDLADAMRRLGLPAALSGSVAAHHLRPGAPPASDEYAESLARCLSLGRDIGSFLDAPEPPPELIARIAAKDRAWFLLEVKDWLAIARGIAGQSERASAVFGLDCRPPAGWRLQLEARARVLASGA